MAQQNEPPAPHGDPLLEDVVSHEENRAQRDSDAAPDATTEPGADDINNSDRAGGRGSDANGVPAFDEADGERRKRQYEEGAEIVSRID